MMRFVNKKTDYTIICVICFEVGSGIEPLWTVLQTVT